MHVHVKICGITSERDGVLAAQAGASAIGLVFWPKGKRFVERARARQIVEELPSFVLRVGVFVDQSLDTMTRTAEDVGLDVIQLHGHEPPEMVACLSRRVVKALDGASPTLGEEIARYESAGILLDSRTKARPGGSGRVFDWANAQRVRGLVRYMVLAGGLNPANVVAAIKAVGPDAVDVSSGVESEPGKKDPVKLKAFMEAVRSLGR